MEARGRGDRSVRKKKSGRAPRTGKDSPRQRRGVGVPPASAMGRRVEAHRCRQIHRPEEADSLGGAPHRESCPSWRPCAAWFRVRPEPWTENRVRLVRVTRRSRGSLEGAARDRSTTSSRTTPGVKPSSLGERTLGERLGRTEEARLEVVGWRVGNPLRDSDVSRSQNLRDPRPRAGHEKTKNNVDCFTQCNSAPTPSPSISSPTARS